MEAISKTSKIEKIVKLILITLAGTIFITISAKVTGGIVAGLLNMAASSDFGASVPLEALTTIKEALEAE